MKEEALKLADSIDEFAQGGYSYKPSDFLRVSAMIRRLVEELDRIKIMTGKPRLITKSKRQSGSVINFVKAAKAKQGIK